jgi:hypothetical protein
MNFFFTRHLAAMILCDGSAFFKLFFYEQSTIQKKRCFNHKMAKRRRNRSKEFDIFPAIAHDSMVQKKAEPLNANIAEGLCVPEYPACLQQVKEFAAYFPSNAFIIPTLPRK